MLCIHPFSFTYLFSSRCRCSHHLLSFSLSSSSRARLCELQITEKKNIMIFFSFFMRRSRLSIPCISIIYKFHWDSNWSLLVITIKFTHKSTNCFRFFSSISISPPFPCLVLFLLSYMFWWPFFLMLNRPELNELPLWCRRILENEKNEWKIVSENEKLMWESWRVVSHNSLSLHASFWRVHRMICLTRWDIAYISHIVWR